MKNFPAFLSIVLAVLWGSTMIFTEQSKGQTPYKVADIIPGPMGSCPYSPVILNNDLYFLTNPVEGTGSDLWKYDGSTASQITYFPASMYPSYLCAFNNNLYFSCDGNDGAGRELWKYDGTTSSRVADIYSGSRSSDPSYLTTFNNDLYFSLHGIHFLLSPNNPDMGKFDGITFSEIPSPRRSSFLTFYNNTLYFSADGEDGAGKELWKYDGTMSSRVADIWSGASDSSPSYLTVYKNNLYFIASSDDGAGRELWKYDGITASKIWSRPNGDPGNYLFGGSLTDLCVFNDSLYFSCDGNDGTGKELWKYDGTTATMVADIWPGGSPTQPPNSSSPASLIVYNNALYFSADGGDGTGSELWVLPIPEPSTAVLLGIAVLSLHCFSWKIKKE